MSLKLDRWICKCTYVWECAYIDIYPVSVHEHISTHSLLSVIYSWYREWKYNRRKNTEKMQKEGSRGGQYRLLTCQEQ